MVNKILDVVHETAEDLYESGAMDTTTMREFDALCLPPIKKFEPKQIQLIRLRSGASQAVFAAYLNVTPSTIQKWEQGQKFPSGASLKLLNLVERKGLKILVE